MIYFLFSALFFSRCCKIVQVRKNTHYVKKFRMKNEKKVSRSLKKKEMIPTKERKRVSRPENKRSRPKITKE